jgi:lysophospholipase L1-like esterase
VTDVRNHDDLADDLRALGDRSPDDRALHAIPAPPLGRLRRSRDALICVGVCVLLLIAFEGASVRRTGQDMHHGWQRSLVLVVGTPAGWLSDRSGLGAVKDRVLAWERTDRGVGAGEGGFAVNAGGDRVPAPVSPEAIDPRALGAKPVAPDPLRTVLVTGDSMSQPLDAELARAFAKAGGAAKVIRDPHIGTGISQTDLLDWGGEAVTQVRADQPDAVVMFLGANEGFPLPVAGRDVECCSAAWAAAYANRARQMMATYRRAGAARVYWLTLPAPRDPRRQTVSRAVNAAIKVAAQPWPGQVRVVDLDPSLTPGGRYRDAVDGEIVREHDGVHLNAAGARIALRAVLDHMRVDWPRDGVPAP